MDVDEVAGKPNQVKVKSKFAMEDDVGTNEGIADPSEEVSCSDQPKTAPITDDKGDILYALVGNLTEQNGIIKNEYSFRECIETVKLEGKGKDMSCNEFGCQSETKQAFESLAADVTSNLVCKIEAEEVKTRNPSPSCLERCFSVSGFNAHSENGTKMHPSVSSDYRMSVINDCENTPIQGYSEVKSESCTLNLVSKIEAEENSSSRLERCSSAFEFDADSENRMGVRHRGASTSSNSRNFEINNVKNNTIQDYSEAKSDNFTFNLVSKIEAEEVKVEKSSSPRLEHYSSASEFDADSENRMEVCLLDTSTSSNSRNLGTNNIWNNTIQDYSEAKSDSISLNLVGKVESDELKVKNPSCSRINQYFSFSELGADSYKRKETLYHSASTSSNFRNSVMNDIKNFTLQDFSETKSESCTLNLVGKIEAEEATIEKPSSSHSDHCYSASEFLADSESKIEMHPHSGIILSDYRNREMSDINNMTIQDSEVKSDSFTFTLVRKIEDDDVEIANPVSSRLEQCFNQHEFHENLEGKPMTHHLNRSIPSVDGRTLMNNSIEDNMEAIFNPKQTSTQHYSTQFSAQEFATFYDCKRFQPVAKLKIRQEEVAADSVTLNLVREIKNEAKIGSQVLSPCERYFFPLEFDMTSEVRTVIHTQNASTHGFCSLNGMENNIIQDDTEAMSNPTNLSTRLHLAEFNKISAVQKYVQPCSELALSSSRPVRFKVREDLDVHSIIKPFSCDQCSASFKAKWSLKNHLGIQTGEKPLSCDQCSSSFKTKTALKQHVSVHSDEKPFSCDKCSSSFKRKKYLKQHLPVHSVEKPFSCDLCSSSFKTKAELKQHLVVHSHEKPFSCGQCSSNFKTKGLLKLHLAVHSDEKPFPCDQCSSIFKRKTDLKRHLAVHSVEKPFSCDLCSSSFKTKAELKQHLVVHSHEKPFSCDQCSSIFKRKTNLKRHLAVHSDKKPFSCDQCSSSFKSKYKLKQHLAVHSDEKPFSCDQCSFSFKTKEKLIKHFAAHSHEKPFSCPVFFQFQNKSAPQTSFGSTFRQDTFSL